LLENELLKMAATAATRAKALSLYRKLMKGAMMMPTPNRQNFVIRKTRTEFKANVNLTDPEAINHCIRLADTNLDTVMVQAEHLTKLMNDPNYQVDVN
jgi:predicted PhzF superfamily epimerase YddE/YHI9